jgi:DNA-binding IclR family transcriptional regulator
VSKQEVEVLRVLELLCENNHPIGISELSELMLSAKSVVFNRIQTLVDKGYVEQDEHTKRYTLTTKLLELTNSSLRGYYERTSIHKYLKIIAQQTSQCTYFGLRNRQNRVVYVDRYTNESAITVYNIGDSPLPHCTAHGKALLAFLSLEEIEAAVKRPLERFTDHTIAEGEKLMEELRLVRQSGVAYDYEESVPGVRCVAAPVFNSYRQVIGSIGISGMATVLTAEILESHAKVVKDVAEKVSISIGNDIAF